MGSQMHTIQTDFLCIIARVVEFVLHEETLVQ